MYLHPTTMWLILFSFWAIVIACNFYVGYVQVQLFHKGLLHTRWRLGSSLLKAALLDATDKRDVRMIRRATVMFNISLMAFTGFLLSIASMAVI